MEGLGEAKPCTLLGLLESRRAAGLLNTLPLPVVVASNIVVFVVPLRRVGRV